MCGSLVKPVTWYFLKGYIQQNLEPFEFFQLYFLDQKLLTIKDQIHHHYFEKQELRKMHLKIGQHTRITLQIV